MRSRTERKASKALDNGDWLAIVSLCKSHPQTATFVQGPHDKTLLHDAAFHGKLTAVHALIAAGADVNAPSRLGFTPLHAAARADRPRIAEALLEAGASADATDHCGSTPLHEAAWRGNVRAATTLLAAANPHAKNSQGQRPVDIVRHTSQARPMLKLLEGAMNGSPDGSSVTTGSVVSFDETVVLG